MPVTCDECYGSDVVRYGTRELSQESVQRFKCKGCGHVFSDRSASHTKYRLKTVLAAVSCYNRGLTLEEAQAEVAKRFKVRVPTSTIHDWLSRYAGTCSFLNHRVDAAALELDGWVREEELYHEQVYKFRCHEAKTRLLRDEIGGDEHGRLVRYLDGIPGSFPHHRFSGDTPRCSTIEYDLLPVETRSPGCAAVDLARFGLEFASTNAERHEAVQEFMVVNDAKTVAAEVPVFLTRDDVGYFRSEFGVDLHEPVTGHVDLLQLRNERLYVLDYKPGAGDVRPLHQLVTYALAVASRLRVPVHRVSCAWFDDRDYFEFFPLHAVHSE